MSMINAAAAAPSKVAGANAATVTRTAAAGIHACLYTGYWLPRAGRIAKPLTPSA
jgi:hypothetical protein